MRHTMWKTAVAMGIGGALLALGLDTPAHAEGAAKTLSIDTSAGRTYSGNIASVIVGATPGNYFVLITGVGGSPNSVCSIATPSLSEALLLRSQIVEAKTTSVECWDTAAPRTTVVAIAYPLAHNQSFRINGGG